MDLRAHVDDAELVRAAQAGDGQAFGVLFDRWSTRVIDVAHRIVRDREVAAEVAQDAFLAAWTGLDRLEQAESFGGWVLRIARNRALNRLERERRSIPVTPVGDEETTVLDRRDDGAFEDADAALARADDAELVWAAAAALGPRDASVLDLHLRHGLSAGEIAEELGVTANTAHQVLFRLRNRLGDAVRACVLWRAGRPACAGLGAAVAASGITSFGAPAVRVISDHALSCRECTGRQEARLAPEALFAALPLLAVSPETLDAIRGGLAEAGVPIPPQTMSSPPPAAPRPRPGPRAMGNKRPAVIAVAAGALVLLVAALLLLGEDDASPTSEEIAASGSSTTTSPQRASSTTSTPTSSTSAPASTASSSTSAPVGSIPAPTPPPTTGPNPEIGTVSEPGLAPNPPTTAAPRPTTTTTTTTTTQPPPAPPRIISFTATRSPGSGCATPSQRVALSWRTADATDIRVAGPGAGSGARPAFGTATGCSPGAGTYVLTASGAGGSVSRTVTVPG